MKTTYVDPLIPLHETSDETLIRLSANIGTLTGLMNGAERLGEYFLAMMFNRARDAKVAQAEGIIELVTVGRDDSADDRRFLLVPRLVSAGEVQTSPHPRPARLPGQLALSV
jgi:hypothetical protein